MPPRGPSSVHPFVCDRPGCPKPSWPRDLDFQYGKERHCRRYHQEAVKVTYQNRTRILYRNPTTQKFDCPCGAPKHARRKSNQIWRMCSKSEHPAPDDDTYAKEAGTDDESANVSTYKRHCGRPRQRPAPSPLPLTRKRRETAPAQSSDDKYHAPVSDPPGKDHRVSRSMAASNSSGQNAGPSGDSGGDGGNLAEVQRSSKRRNAAREKLIKSLENQRSILAQKAEEVDRATAILLGI
ncbi:hypothetical protein K523DRAFT_353820 [Schizophyllum commune Tattone D]|nr:hypothetical protein K523DRAFT_353820 [Schizophyllum commune Tattone D]